MAKSKYRLLDFEVDKLTNSIEHAVSGESFLTDVLLVVKADLGKVVRKEGWLFNWAGEWRMKDRQVYKLVRREGDESIQGLISISIESDHVYVHLVESAPHNRSIKKVYFGVSGNLFAFACLLSDQIGFYGSVSFRSKTRLIEHYSKTLGAVHFGGHLMILTGDDAKNLMAKYYSK